MTVKRIQFERSGGFAPIRLAADFDLSAVPDDQANALSALINDLKFNELPEQSVGASPVPDGFVYNITVHTDAGKHTVITGDPSAGDKMDQLIEMLTAIAKEQMRKQR